MTGRERDAILSEREKTVWFHKEVMDFLRRVDATAILEGLSRVVMGPIRDANESIAPMPAILASRLMKTQSHPFHRF